MPTGYTSVFQDGKSVTRNEFIMRCARAFGALVSMRDDGLDAEIPDSFEPSPYAKENLDRAKSQLEHYQTISEDAAKEKVEREYQQEVARYEDAIKRENALRIQYQLTLVEVEHWNPPTEEHEELKRFCIKQLTDSINHDCNYYINAKKPERQEVDKWIKDKISYHLREVSYYENDWAEQVERTKKRNAWIKQLRDSLKDAE